MHWYGGLPTERDMRRGLWGCGIQCESTSRSDCHTLCLAPHTVCLHTCLHTFADEEGFFHTGDIGMLVADGSLRIIDRMKNIFKLSHGGGGAGLPLCCPHPLRAGLALGLCSLLPPCGAHQRAGPARHGGGEELGCHCVAHTQVAVT